MNLRFESPWLLLLLVLLPLLAFWQVWQEKSPRQQPALRYADTRLVVGLGWAWRIRLRWLLPALRLTGVALVIVSLARPHAGQVRDVVKGEGVDIALALDISGSMAALDFKPQNRLEAAKQVIGDFIEKRTYDRIGLIVFASTAFHQCPPTVDHAVLARLLEEVRLATDLGIEDSTAMGIGLANAANMLKTSTVKSRVVILLTDGVNNTGEIDPLTAAEAARTLGIKVYTVGMGKTGRVPVPVVDAFGRQTITYRQSELDEETLRAIAEKTGGLYFRAEDTAGLQRIYADINRLEKSQIEIQHYERYQELAGWLLLPALCLFLLELVLQHTWLRRLP